MKDWGSFQDNLFFTVWKDNGAGDHSCNNILDTDETAIITNQKLRQDFGRLQIHQPVFRFPAALLFVTEFPGIFPLKPQTIIQTDSLVSDIKFTAVQSRNIDDFRCSGLTPTNCTPTNGGEELCDGVDNNCNGQTDEGNPGGGGACSTELLGVCSAGNTQCQGGALRCTQNVQSSTEVCDGLDNDCDGATDEGNPGGGIACGTGLAGICAAGTTQCQSGAINCIQNVQSSAEIPGNGLDDDCDGSTDEAGVLGIQFSCTENSDCNDGNPCTNDVCINEICEHSKNDQGVCNDGNGCTNHRLLQQWYMYRYPITAFRSKFLCY